MIAIIDYGAGNLFSVKNALDFIDEESIITSEKAKIISADRIILPGVGAFPDAMKMFKKTDLIDTIKEQATKKPLLGICLGMQVLFDEGCEFEKTKGLSFIEGSIDRIQTDLKIPHMGYNQLEINKKSPLLEGIQEFDCVYFVHSFMAYTDQKNVLAYCDYNVKIPALVQKGNVYGAQFHPEKSGEVGLQILRNFARLT
ncbi:MAG: imidazole glycerol phosphate synthase subunit HisH [Oscillospiraceae bacterium]